MRKMFPLIVLLLLPLSAVYCDSHSLRFYYTAVSTPGSGLPAFTTVGYVDDREIVNYNSNSRKYRPKVQWMEKVEPEYWERETTRNKEYQAIYKNNVKIAMSRFNQTGGFHIVQWMHGCELRDDGTIRGYNQHGYDGREFTTLDTETWTFIATMAQAQITTQRWNSPEEQQGERWKNNIENYCIEWLKKHVEDGREDLERRVQPQVKVSGQEEEGILTLHCHVYGFHPKPVDVKWMKNREDDIPTYKTTHVLPNPDGTYQIRVTAEVIPKESDSYSCYVDHSSLGEPLSIVWEPTKPSSWVIPVVIAVVVIALLGAGIAGFLLYRKKTTGYTPTSKPDKFFWTIKNLPFPSVIISFHCVIYKEPAIYKNLISISSGIKWPLRQITLRNFSQTRRKLKFLSSADTKLYRGRCTMESCTAPSDSPASA